MSSELLKHAARQRQCLQQILADAISALAVSEMRHTGEEDSFKSQWLRFVPPGLTVADSVFELCASFLQ